jgi:hypothetical protein
MLGVKSCCSHSSQLNTIHRTHRRLRLPFGRKETTSGSCQRPIMREREKIHMMMCEVE